MVFTQIGVEALASNARTFDAELILMTADLWQRPLRPLPALHLNTLAPAPSAPSIAQALIAHLEQHKDALTKTASATCVLKPLRVLDSKTPLDAGPSATTSCA